MATWLERWTVPPGEGPTVAVKDLIDVAGSVTTAGCRALADQAVAAAADASCIESVRAGGGRLVGKTNLHELAFGTTGINPWFGTPANPADPGRVPGGSSSGSAVAAAVGEADLALGSDTGGSVRIPAACCGVVGLKTTHGLLSLEGVWPLAPSFDTVGVLAADVERVVIGMELLGAGFSPVTDVPDTVGMAELPRQVAERIDPVVSEAVASALRAAGLALAGVRLDHWLEAHLAQQRLLCREAWLSDRHLLADGGAGVSDEVRERLIVGQDLADSELAEAAATRTSWTRQMADAVGRHGVVALPTLAVRPYPIDEIGAGFNVLTAPVNMAGFPAISVPVPVAESGRGPAGLQFVGLPGTEALLCALAARVEAAVA